MVAATETSDGSVIVTSDTAAVDPEGGTLWNLDITAATGVADILVQPDVFAGSNAFFDMTGGGTAGEILFRMRVNSVIGTPVLTVGMEDSAGSGESELAYTADGQWQQYSVKISDVVTDSVMNATTLDLAGITNLFKLSATGGSINLDIDDIQVKVACRDTDGCEVTPSLTEIPVVVRFTDNFEDRDPANDSTLGNGWITLTQSLTATRRYSCLLTMVPHPMGRKYQRWLQIKVDQSKALFSCRCTVTTSVAPRAVVIAVQQALDSWKLMCFRKSLWLQQMWAKRLKFSFNAKRGNIELASTAFAFIKVLDPNSGFSTTDIVELKMTGTSVDWTPVELELAVGDWDGQLLQFGFRTLSGNFEASGVFYDNIEVSETGP